MVMPNGASDIPEFSAPDQPFIWLPERGSIAQLHPDGRQNLWERSGVPNVWRPLELGEIWKLVSSPGHQR